MPRAAGSDLVLRDLLLHSASGTKDVGCGGAGDVELILVILLSGLGEVTLLLCSKFVWFL
jgi:hypothetical protein